MFSRGQNFPRYKHLGVKLICHETVYFKCAIYSVTVSSDKTPLHYHYYHATFPHEFVDKFKYQQMLTPYFAKTCILSCLK